MKGDILDVGGLLRIGIKDAAVDMKSIKFLNEDDGPDDFFLVEETNKEDQDVWPEGDG